MRVKILTASYLLDWILGDPEFVPHPVRYIGKAIAHGECALRRPRSGPLVEFIGGLVLTGGIVACSAVAVSTLLSALHRLSPSRARLVEIVCGFRALLGATLPNSTPAELRAPPSRLSPKACATE
jgi:adenosylcobinamide-phosphate synthase